MLQFTGQRKIDSFLIENSMKTISVLGNNSGRNAGDVWRNKDEIRQRLKPLVAREKQKAKSSAKYLQAFLN